MQEIQPHYSCFSICLKTFFLLMESTIIRAPKNQIPISWWGQVMMLLWQTLVTLPTRFIKANDASDSHRRERHLLCFLMPLANVPRNTSTTSSLLLLKTNRPTLVFLPQTYFWPIIPNTVYAIHCLETKGFVEFGSRVIGQPMLYQVNKSNVAFFHSCDLRNNF